MFFCEICNKPADIHHIVHRSEGGLDIEINYKYLCNEHHRGKNGPHHSIEIDLKYKLDIIGYGFLIPIFFIMVGVNLDITTIFQRVK